MDEQIRAVRAVRDEIADRLSSALIEAIDELLDNDEPNEALLTLAWAIAEARIEVPPSVLLVIEDTVGDPKDLPVDLTGRRSWPPERRGSAD